MKSRSSLAMMEQIVMLAVFALAAALCLQAFVKSDQMSRNSEARDRAIQEAQSAAEAVRHTGGDLEKAAELLDAIWMEDSLSIMYAEDWTRGEPIYPSAHADVYPFGYSLGVCRMDSGVPGLGKAGVWVQEDETGEELVRLEVCWQEEVGAS